MLIYFHHLLPYKSNQGKKIPYSLINSKYMTKAATGWNYILGKLDESLLNEFKI
jgi:hypothetical protein